MVIFRDLSINPLKSFKYETYHINLKIPSLCSDEISLKYFQPFKNYKVISEKRTLKSL